MLNLTEWEQQAVDAPINLSDGHPRQALTESQLKLVYRLPELFETAQIEPFGQLERSAQRTFLHALGQSSAPVDSGRIFSIYSSSVATMALAVVLAGHRVALIHPTFDNIHDIFARTLPVLPVSEEMCAEAALAQASAGGATCLFVTTPNNPTGWLLERPALDRLARACADRGLLLCLDVSFRGFDPRAQYDHYAVLDRTGVSYVVIEDTGKLWPMQELKLGFLAVSEDLRPAVQHVLSDVLLTVSPMILKLVEVLANDAANGGLARLRRLIAHNREQVVATVEDLGDVEIADRDSLISVCRLRFRSGVEAERVREALGSRGVEVLPCQQFHWAHPADGDSLLRLALARSPEVIADGLGRLKDIYRRS